jgi:transketolase
MSMYLIQDFDNPQLDAVRNGFGRGLVEAGRRDEKVVALCADLTGSVKMDGFAKEFPERFVQVGVAEQNLVTVASGMAAMGYLPFTASYAAFSPGRNWEQIRTTIALNDRPVKIVGGHAGLITGPDGATHQMLEDIALMRVMPNMVVVVPGDSIEAEKATLAIAEDSRPAYLRLARDPTAVFTSERTPFSLKRAHILSPGKDVSIMATGIMTYQALLAAEKLYKDGIDAEVVHIPVIKPLDAITVLQSAQRTGAVVTVEEAQIAGGFGSAIAELLGEHHPTPMRRMGVQDRFGESGTPAELFEHFGLNARAIAHTVHGLLTELGRQ